MKSSKNQEFPPHVVKEDQISRILFLNISNQARIKIFQIPILGIKQESRIEIQDLKMRLAEIQELKK